MVPDRRRLGERISPRLLREARLRERDGDWLGYDYHWPREIQELSALFKIMRNPWWEGPRYGSGRISLIWVVVSFHLTTRDRSATFDDKMSFSEKDYVSSCMMIYTSLRQLWKRRKGSGMRESSREPDVMQARGHPHHLTTSETSRLEALGFCSPRLFARVAGPKVIRQNRILRIVTHSILYLARHFNVQVYGQTC